MEATEHVFTLNPADVKITHASFADDRPLCGWCADDDLITRDGSEVTCRDCQVAQEAGRPRS